MKRYLLFILLACFVITGCQTPIGKFLGLSKKVETTKQDIAKNNDKLNNDVISYVYGADFALSLDKNPNIYSSTAKNMTDHALVISGPPSLSEVNRLKEIVNNLTSTNKDLVLKGEKQLKEKDNEVIVLQKQNEELSNKLIKQEEKLKEVNQENANLASKWARVITIFWWSVWIISAGFILSIIGKILPPPYNNIAAILGIPIGFVVKLFIGLLPSIKESAGVVAAKLHDESQITLEKLVLSIEELRKTKPQAFGELEPILKNKTDSEITRPKIQSIKQDYGLV